MFGLDAGASYSISTIRTSVMTAILNRISGDRSPSGSAGAFNDISAGLSINASNPITVDTIELSNDNANEKQASVMNVTMPQETVNKLAVGSGIESSIDLYI